MVSATTCLAKVNQVRVSLGQLEREIVLKSLEEEEGKKAFERLEVFEAKLFELEKKLRN